MAPRHLVFTLTALVSAASAQTSPPTTERVVITARSLPGVSGFGSTPLALSPLQASVIGAAERALELMVKRLLNRTAFRKQLAEHSVWEQRVADAPLCKIAVAGFLNDLCARIKRFINAMAETRKAEF